MKPHITHILSCLFLISTVAGGCSKSHHSRCNESVPYVSDTTNFTGIWELTETSGGLSGRTEAFAPCNGNRYIFSNSTYEQYANHTFVKQGTYRIYRDHSITTNQQGNRIVFDNDTVSRQFVKNDGSYLFLMQDAADGIGSRYARREFPEE